MKVFVSKDFDGFWPVGTSAIIIAENESAAIFWLEQALRAEGLKDTEFTVQEIPTTEPKAFILNNGDY